MMTEALAPGRVIGILGGGQLGKMLAQAAAKLGFRVHVFAPDGDAPATHVAAKVITAPYDDVEALKAFARGVDVLTFEFENIPAESLRVVEDITRLRPGCQALAITQDRLHERDLLSEVNAPQPGWARVDDAAGLDAAFDALNGPSRSAGLFLKTRREGYDGKGQFRVHSREDLAPAADWLGDRRAILEQGVPFDFEFSVIAARGMDGPPVFYDSPANTHAEGRLAISRVPAPLTQEERTVARDVTRAVMDALDYCGVLAVEFFACRAEGGIRVNEIAPRVHNTGHWTLEACAISQFENHIRAIAGWPLGAPDRHSDAEMVNIIGPDIHEWSALIGYNPARSIHIYGKTGAAPGRKMGHYTDLLPLSAQD